MKILIAEDDEISRRMMGTTLRRMGYEVEMAADGREALFKLMEPDGPRLALVDWMMPEMDGLEVCRRVRAANGQMYVYLILLTSKDTPEALVEGLDAGADEYLTKPCHADELKARLRTGERILHLEDKLVSARDEMRFKATHDALTSLWNRGRILEALDEALLHMDPIAILMCDIDHFKAVNDEYGHLVGDAVLRELAVRLRRGVRSNDLIGRFGGEEFLILLNGCDPEFLQDRAEQLRRAASETTVLTDAGEISFTLSIGAVPVNKEDCFAPAETVLNLADAALYQAKREGRDRVVIARRLVGTMACCEAGES